MIVWKSERVSMSSKAYYAAKASAETVAAAKRGRVEWQDEYNDFSAVGVFAVRVR